MQNLQAERAKWGNFPAVVSNAGLKSLANEPEYYAAKTGNREAALTMVNRVLTDETIESVRCLLDGLVDVRITPVLAEEANGQNKIPLLTAEVIAHRLGMEVEYGICQVERVYRTNSNADHRLAFSPTFDGEVMPGRSYFIVDDTLTMGGTLASLRGYIVNRGGHVPGAAVMTAHEGALNLPVSSAMLDRIRAKHGDEMNNYWNKEFGYEIDKLTQAEAGHLRAAASVDAIRTRIATARDGARRTLGKEDAGQDGQTLKITGFENYQKNQINRAQVALDHAQEAFWSSGDSLPALRAEIEQYAETNGADPGALLASVFSEDPPIEFTQRIADAIAASPETQTLEKSVRHARRHLRKQLRRKTPASILNANNDGCALE
jgi:orotate phosphoribosyltransferase-like protein